MENSSNYVRLIHSQYLEVLSNFEPAPINARRQARELLRNSFIPPITRARCNLMMAWIAPDPEDGEEFLEDCREALAWNIEIGREPPTSDFEGDMARCAAELQERRENPDDDYGLCEDEPDGDMSHEAWIRWYFEEPSAETPTNEPTVGLESDPAETIPRASRADADDDNDAEYDEEELAALPTSDTRQQLSSRPADGDSAILAFDPQSDAPDMNVPDTDAPHEPGR